MVRKLELSRQSWYPIIHEADVDYPSVAEKGERQSGVYLRKNDCENEVHDA